MNRYVILLGFLVLVTGCATTQGAVSTPGQPVNPDRVQTALNDLADFSVADLTWASQDAHAKNDLIFYTCWDGLIPVVQELKATKQANGGVLPPFPKGVASGVQVIRDMIRGATGGVGLAGNAASGPSVVDRIVVACAGMSQAILADQAKVASTIGSAMSGVGAAPAAIAALKGIGPILKVMPLPIPLG